MCSFRIEKIEYSHARWIIDEQYQRQDILSYKYRILISRASHVSISKKSLPETWRLERSIELRFLAPVNDKQETIENRLSNQLPSDDAFPNVFKNRNEILPFLHDGQWLLICTFYVSEALHVSKSNKLVVKLRRWFVVAKIQ